VFCFIVSYMFYMLSSDLFCIIILLYLLFGMCFVFFFFSSRRRHTRSKRDWSSDVCSSDLRWEVFISSIISLYLSTKFLILSYASSTLFVTVILVLPSVTLLNVKCILFIV